MEVFIMERYEDQQLTTVREEEVLVTNTAIKTTDVLMAIGAGVFAVTGVSLLVNSVRKGKRLKEKQDFEARIIGGLIAEGASEAEIQNARDLLRRMI